eukprot:UN22663
MFGQIRKMVIFFVFQFHFHILLRKIIQAPSLFVLSKIYDSCEHERLFSGNSSKSWERPVMKKPQPEQPYRMNVLITIFLVALLIGIILFGRTSKSEDLTSPMSPVQIFTTTTHVPKITMVNKTPVPHSVLQTLTQRPTPRPTLQLTPRPTLQPTPRPTLQPTPIPTLQPSPIGDISVSQSSQIWA